jgi:hypothetical protein
MSGLTILFQAWIYSRSAISLGLEMKLAIGNYFWRRRKAAPNGPSLGKMTGKMIFT